MLLYLEIDLDLSIKDIENLVDDLNCKKIFLNHLNIKKVKFCVS